MTQQASTDRSPNGRFPRDEYTPYGYLHTPSHTGIHPAGIIRSVPPLGFGLWTGGLHWYAMDQLRHVNNYVCMVLPCVEADGLLLCEREDFDRAGIPLRSRYHSANIMSYDFSAEGMDFSFLWFLLHEDALAVKVTLRGGPSAHAVTIDLEERYGMNCVGWWGADEATEQGDGYGGLLSGPFGFPVYRFPAMIRLYIGKIHGIVEAWTGSNGSLRSKEKG